TRIAELGVTFHGRWSERLSSRPSSKYSRVPSLYASLVNQRGGLASVQGHVSAECATPPIRSTASRKLTPLATKPRSAASPTSADSGVTISYVTLNFGICYSCLFAPDSSSCWRPP